MALASLDNAPAVGQPVDRTTKLGSTWCTGMVPCTAASGNHHLHLELRSGISVSGATVALGSNVALDGRTIGGWTIKAGQLNYNGTATACGTTITADVAGPPIYDASACNGPVSPPTVLSGTWVAPKDGAKLTNSTLTLSAKASVTPTTLSVSKVAFSVRWGSTTKAACSATKAGSGGVWSCKADLWKLGAPLGKLTLSFEVTDSAGDVAKAPAGVRTVTFWAPPPAPTGVTSKDVDNGDGTFTTTVHWRSSSQAIIDGFVVYAALSYVSDPPMPGDPPPPKCPAPPFKSSGRDANPWRLVLRVGPNARSVSYVTNYGPAIACGIWVGAYNAAGTSTLAK